MWRPDERTFISDLSIVTALAATRQVVYAATLGGVASYDRVLGTWNETIGPLEGMPRIVISAMAADPSDDTAWMAGEGRWLSWSPFSRRLDVGTLPGGEVRQVVLDAANPSGGAWFNTTAGWYFVARGSLVAMRADPPRSPLRGAIGEAELRRQLPAFDAIRARIETDEQLRRFHVTTATRVPVENDLFVGTDGNGTFRVESGSHMVTRLPAGIAGSRVTVLSSWRGWTCAGAEPSLSMRRTAVTCFDEALASPIVIGGSRTLSIPMTTIRALLVTERAVWIGMDGGLLRVERNRDRSDLLTTAQGLPSDGISALTASATGAWVGTVRGLVHVADTGRAFETGPVITTRPVAALAMHEDLLLVGTRFGLFGLPSMATELTASTQLTDGVESIAVRGRDGAAVSRGRLFLDSDRNRERSVPGIGPLHSVVADSSGFWVAGVDGLAWLGSDRMQTWPSAELGGMPIRDIAVSDGYVWLGTDAGVVRFDKRVLRR